MDWLWNQRKLNAVMEKKFPTKFEIPNDYWEIILFRDSDFILPDRTSAICIMAAKSLKVKLESDFKRKYQNVEVLFRQRLGLGGLEAFPPPVWQVSGKYLCFFL